MIYELSFRATGVCLVTEVIVDYRGGMYRDSVNREGLVSPPNP